MKIVLLALSLTLPSFGSTAYDYDYLNNLFDEGTEPTFQEVMGWWSGRCFKKDNPKIPLAFLLIASEDSDQTKHLAVVSHFSDNKNPDRYDTLTPDDHRDFLNFTRGPDYRSSEVSFILGGIYSHIGYGAQGIKKSNQFLVGSLRHSHDSDYNYHCYFVKKVQ